MSGELGEIAEAALSPTQSERELGEGVEARGVAGSLGRFDTGFRSGRRALRRTAVLWPLRHARSAAAASGSRHVGDLVVRACQLQRSPGNRVGADAKAEAETSRCGVGSCTEDSMNDRAIDELG